MGWRPQLSALGKSKLRGHPEIIADPKAQTGSLEHLGQSMDGGESRGSPHPSRHLAGSLPTQCVREGQVECSVSAAKEVKFPECSDSTGRAQHTTTRSHP
jgi:hypothetical protein